MSPTELTKVRDALARALSVDDVNQFGRDNAGPPPRTLARWGASGAADSDLRKTCPLTLFPAAPLQRRAKRLRTRECSRLEVEGFAEDDSGGGLHAQLESVVMPVDSAEKPVVVQGELPERRDRTGVTVHAVRRRNPHRSRS